MQLYLVSCILCALILRFSQQHYWKQLNPKGLFTYSTSMHVDMCRMMLKSKVVWFLCHFLRIIPHVDMRNDASWVIRIFTSHAMQQWQLISTRKWSSDVTPHSVSLVVIWNMDCKILIESVRKREILHVSTSTAYKNVEKKKVPWAAVAEEVGCSGCMPITYLKLPHLPR